jgi:hypothetical protein
MTFQVREHVNFYVFLFGMLFWKITYLFSYHHLYLHDACPF